MPKKSFSITETVNEQFEQLFQQSLADRPELTQGALFAELISDHNDREKTLSELRDQLVSLQVSNQETEKETIEKLRKASANLEETQRNLQVIHEKLDASDMETALANLSRLRELSEKPAETIEKFIEQPLAENEIRLIVPETPTRKLLDETCRRLSQRLGKEVTPADLLLDIFNRYTIEQFNEWMFPFVIKPSEFKELTGYSQNELKEWLKSLQ